MHVLLLSMLVSGVDIAAAAVPIVANTWAFTNATDRAWNALHHAPADGTAALTAVEQGCTLCEEEQCDFTVGYGGSPDEAGHTTLDAMIMDGGSMAAGAVAALQATRQAISAARLVMQHSSHTLLAGAAADAFAQEMGLRRSNLSTAHSVAQHQKWQEAHCQPNFRRNAVPDPAQSCGPYQPASGRVKPPAAQSCSQHVQQDNHDTIAMIAIDANGSIAVGASSNGASHKVPGRVGDAAVPGGGAYADNEVGACGSTGDGDIHLRFLPCYQVVESMRMGFSPKAAAEAAVRRMVQKYPAYVGAVLAVDRDGRHAAACHGWTFTYAVRSVNMDTVRLYEVQSLRLPSGSDAAFETA